MKLPFPMLGLDVDNDSAFINETVVNYCKDRRIELTRSRPYKKNDQAWIEQKNGSVVRRIVGYGRLEGAKAATALGKLHELARLYVNLFQPSFKLKSKNRDGSKVTKKYYLPATPYERLLASNGVANESKEQLRQVFSTLDPVQLLHLIREAQRALVAPGELVLIPSSVCGLKSSNGSTSNLMRPQRKSFSGFRFMYRVG
jgi:hypothetical protein